LSRASSSLNIAGFIQKFGDKNRKEKEMEILEGEKILKNKIFHKNSWKILKI